MKFNIDIPEDNRRSLVVMLNVLLADEIVLSTKTRNYHWNATGPNFAEYHKFFETQYGQIEEIVDDVAERSRALGGVALGSLAEFAKSARLTETPGATLGSKDMLANLLANHEAVIRSLRSDLEDAVSKYKDSGTCDFLTGVMEIHEKMAWMIRAHLQG